MAETLEQFVTRRRRELDEEARRLSEALAALKVEREKLDRTAELLAANRESVDNNISYDETRIDTSTRHGDNTIKGMVLHVLGPASSGMTALEILSAINRQAARPFARTSLSPQLSRLKNERKIHRSGRVWYVGPASEGSEEDEGDAAD